VTKNPTTDEIVLTEVEPTETETTTQTENLPEEISGHKVTYTDDNASAKDETETGSATVETPSSTNWLLIGLIALPPIFILIILIERKIAKKLNENG
jgi:hypothetical protein